MKTIYIPNGETVHYESLVTDRLVVKVASMWMAASRPKSSAAAVPFMQALSTPTSSMSMTWRRRKLSASACWQSASIPPH